MLYSSTNILKLQYDSFDILSCYFYGRFYLINVSIFSEALNESFHDDPLFLFHFRVMYMYIFHFVKGQENFNSRSKMAHLPLNADTAKKDSPGVIILSSTPAHVMDVK